MISPICSNKNKEENKSDSKKKREESGREEEPPPLSPSLSLSLSHTHAQTRTQLQLLRNSSPQLHRSELKHVRHHGERLREGHQVLPVPLQPHLLPVRRRHHGLRTLAAPGQSELHRGPQRLHSGESCLLHPDRGRGLLHAHGLPGLLGGRLRDPLPARPVLHLPPADPSGSDRRRRPHVLPEGRVKRGNVQGRVQGAGQLPGEQLQHGAGVGLHPVEHGVLWLELSSGLEREHGDREQLPAAVPLLLPEHLAGSRELLRQRLLRGADARLARLRRGLCCQRGELAPHQHRRSAGYLPGGGAHRAAGDDLVHVPVQERPQGGLHQSAKVLKLQHE